MRQANDGTHQRFREIISYMWDRLTNDEIYSYEERRDVFFITVRKKHGVSRAQAEMMLREALLDLEDQVGEAG